MSKDDVLKKAEDRLAFGDRLAVNRTRLANERTLLAYVRTALALFAVGVTFIKFFEHYLIEVTGWLFLPLAAYTAVKGVQSFRETDRRIAEEEVKSTGM